MEELCYEKLMTVCDGAFRDIRDHIYTIYWLARISSSNGIIVEIGVRGGDSTRALMAAANDCNAKLYSIDIEGCHDAVKINTEKLGLKMMDGWNFIQSDSVEAAKQWNGRPVNFLFIDSCHLYPETLYELNAWFPYMADRSIMAGHDYFLPDKPRDGVGRSVREFFHAHSDRYDLETRRNCCGLFILWPKSSTSI
jgi:predicted O-methyltransferase YrrM